MRYLIGVDDTDDAKSAGTGQLVRRLAEWLQADRLLSHTASPGTNFARTTA